MKYIAIEECKDEFDWSISVMCEILEIHRGSYYKWKRHKETDHEQENLRLINIIDDYHTKYRGILGYRRMCDWINKYKGMHVNHKRIHRLMRVMGIKSIIRAKRKAYHYSTPSTVKENVLNREFEATRPNEKWLTDVTVFKIAGMSTKYYLSAIIDLYDLSIISYQISPKNDNILVFETFHKAFNQYPDAQPLVHSDRGFQYTSPSFNSILKNQGCVQSMSRVGCCIDNGPIENFWGQIKSERYYLEDYRSPETLINGITDYIDFYNHERLQARFKNQSPIEVRYKAFNSTPEYYPIPINPRIEKYWNSIRNHNIVNA